tara:strand:+ start:159 stop:473 length:315 start_codon:yes stop_codon:yes gene_type:complete
MAVQNERFRSFEEVTQTTVAVSTVAADVTNGKPFHLTVQNIGTQAVWMRVGATAATTGTNYSYILAGGAADNDGTGAMIDISGYTGTISFITASGTSNVVVSQG